MTRVLRREVSKPLPPHRILRQLAAGVHAGALDRQGLGGWGTAPGKMVGGWSLLAVEPEIEFRGGPEALAEAQDWLDRQRCAEPLAAILLGFLSYDLGRFYERLPRIAADDIPIPPVSLAGFRAVYVYDRESQTGTVIGSRAEAVDRLYDRIVSIAPRTRPIPLPEAPKVKPRSSDTEFERGVRAIQDWIRAGDVYQVNLARRVDLKPLPRQVLPNLYGILTEQAGAPFSAYLDTPDGVIVSASPERFLRVSGDQVETCPIKGTRPRGATPEEDVWLQKELLHSPKDRAEHIMIVDLERNDLGRICRTGTVAVRQMAELRSFANVHHLVSSVVGRLHSPRDWSSILRATFPGGSITGAPKIRAMQIIEALEPVRRGVYTGAIGYFDATGGVDLSIAIRTGFARNEVFHLHLGAGIVADSDARTELLETRDKGLSFAKLYGASL